ncbi:ALG11 [Cordylochernes scorpioides]|uniref:GDP-Man:Man(3)GlcNAc(2)-PP-Dol alpha-1,2-mannosyltransferase n=1 Tax=Cordylochernes scorpioides TaxID=51811 RepID=A0ABY6KUR7_9ARAC|nr:ALG11 [Cordylochernes scorpioides]
MMDAQMDLVSLVLALVIPVLVAVLVLGTLRLLLQVERWQQRGDKRVVAFFHPYCHAAGGGEKVLWLALQALQTCYPELDYVIYTGDNTVTADQILAKVKDRLNIELVRRPRFVFLSLRVLVEASSYPYFTLLGQSLGSLALAMEALLRMVPDIVIDTQGYAFAMPLFRYLGTCRVACYTHYPVISTDMLERVGQQETAHNNHSFISSNPQMTQLKLIYYNAFAMMYRAVGHCMDVVMVNSSWTRDHILHLWKLPHRTFTVFPPCSVKELAALPAEKRERKILSIAQFRPEKDHPLQLRAFSKLLSELGQPATLVLAGGCRNQDDQNRVEDLRKLAAELDIAQHVEFKLNIPFEELKKEMETSMIGLHTMWNEHFGIGNNNHVCAGVVDCMAAGMVMVSHDSGGPKLDIVVPVGNQPTGFLATTEEEFAAAMAHVLAMSAEERAAIVARARQHVRKFSNENFTQAFLQAIKPIFPSK